MTYTSIEWTDRVWNPVTGCTKVSQGCKNCYAERIAARFWGDRKFTDVVCHEDRLAAPLHWSKPARVFVNSMSDLFHPAVPDEFIYETFGIMELCTWHTFMVLTKRPERMLKFTKGTEAIFPENVWLGVSVENQAAADERIPLLLQTPAAVRFVSCEPLLGPVDMSLFLHAWHSTVSYDVPPLGWVICGGESGPGARPMHPDWARGLLEQCQTAQVPFFFKQFGEWQATERGADWKETGYSDCPYYHPRLGTSWIEDQPFIKVGKKHAGRLLDGREWNEFPGGAS